MVSSPKTRWWSALSLVGLASLALVVGLVVAPIGESGRAIYAAGSVDGAGGEFHRLQPFRVLDTRNPALDVAPVGKKTTVVTADGSHRTSLDVNVFGTDGQLSFVDANGDGFDDNVLAVSVTLTVVDPTAGGYLQAYGAGSNAGIASSVNFVDQTVPNTAVLRPGQQGNITLDVFTGAQSGEVHLLVDVLGWFSTSNYPTRGARLIPLDAPARIFDTGGADGQGPALTGRTQTPVRVRGAGTIFDPVTAVIPDNPDIVGVAVNVTSDNTQPGSTGSFVSLLPAPVPDGASPTTSNLNVLAGDIAAGMSLAPLSDDGTVFIYNHAGESRLIVDVVGYFVAGADVSTRSGRVWPIISPFRAFDTRADLHQRRPLGERQSEDWSFASFVADVNVEGVPVGAQSAVLGNLTATGLRGRVSWDKPKSWIGVQPSPVGGQNVGIPQSSNLNFGVDEAVPNLALLRFGGDTRVRVYNHNGIVDYLFDAYAVVLSD